MPASCLLRRVILSAFFLGLSGCTLPVSRTSPTSLTGHAMAGVVHGGQQPIAGAIIQLYAVNTAQDGDASMALLSSTVRTNQNGNFDFTGAYTCPAGDPLVYLTATGGNPGLNTPTNNTASTLMILLGACSTLTSLPYLIVNEVTTVASIYPLTQFMTAYQAIGAAPANQALLADAFARAQEFISLQGASPGPATPSGYSVPTAALYSLANSVSACVNSAGGTAGDGTSCGNLFADATPMGGVVPSETAGAILNLANNPTLNVTAIYNVATPAAPFAPALGAAPTDWSLKILPSQPLAMPERGNLLAEYLLQEGSGSIAYDSSGLGHDSILNGPAWEGSMDVTLPHYGEYLQAPAALNPTRTWQFALYNPVYGSATLPQAPGYGAPQGNWPYALSVLCGTTSLHLCLTSNSLYSTAQQFAVSNNGNDYTESAVTFPVGWHIFTLICGSSTAKTHYLFDGVEVSSYRYQGDVSTCLYPTSGNYQIGGSSLAANGNGWLLGKIAGVWSWSVPLTLSEGAAAAQAALQLLQTKEIQTSFANFPSDGNPVLVGGLDSRTYGVQLPPQGSWLYQMQLSTAYRRVNMAFTGEKAWDACAQFDLTYGLQIGTASVPTITVIWGGVNDFGTPIAHIASALQCMVGKAKALGSRVVLATELGAYANNTTGYDQAKDQLDPIIRANAFAWGADNLADLASDPLIGADGATANISCFPDNLHPGPNCEPDITAIMQNAVNELLGSTANAPNSTAAASYQEGAGDDYLDLTGTSQTVALPSCVGLSLPRQVDNTGSTSAAVQTFSSQLLTGTSSITPGTTAQFTPMPAAPSTGGCSWVRTK
jgi:hypothetical protein